ncbi:hypothetical protein ACFLSQ_12055 [Bacteroidota bacterium]
MNNATINKLSLIITLLILSINYTLDSAEAKSPDLLYVGVLETKPLNWGDSVVYEYDSLTKKIVRVLFFKTAKGWGSLEDNIDDKNIYPSKVSWTIAFDGKNLGHFTSKAAPLPGKMRWTLPRDAHHKPITKNLPKVGKPTYEFSGEPGFFVPRPLIVVSKENYIDLEKWKPFSPNKKMINKIKKNYINYVRNLFYKEYNDLNRIKSLKSYSALNGDVLIQICHIKTF